MYDYDYGNDTYRKNTGWHSAKDRLGDGDIGYVGSDGLPG